MLDIALLFLGIKYGLGKRTEQLDAARLMDLRKVCFPQ